MNPKKMFVETIVNLLDTFQPAFFLIKKNSYRVGDKALITKIEAVYNSAIDLQEYLKSRLEG